MTTNNLLVLFLVGSPWIALFLAILIGRRRKHSTSKVVVWYLLIFLFWPIFLPIFLFTNPKQFSTSPPIQSVAADKKKASYSDKSSAFSLCAAVLLLPAIPLVGRLFSSEDLGWALLYLGPLSMLSLLISLTSLAVDRPNKKSLATVSLLLSTLIFIWALLIALGVANA